MPSMFALIFLTTSVGFVRLRRINARKLIFHHADDPDNCMIAILNIKVRCKRVEAKKLFEVRCLLDKVLASKITDTTNHSTQYNKFEEDVLNTVIQLITAEDEKAEYLGDDIPDSDNSESDSERYH